MIENGYYKVKDSYFSLSADMFGSIFKSNKDGNRPVFCCFEDSKTRGLFWAVPTGNAENKDLTRINMYIDLPKNKIGWSYY